MTAAGAVVFTGVTAGAAAPASASPPAHTRAAEPPLEVNVTAANWEQIRRYSNDRPVILDFGDEMCLGCKEVAKALHQMVTNDKGAWIVGSVDRVAYPELHAMFDVTTLPTLVVLRNGIDQSAVMPRVVGYNGGNAEWVKLWQWIQKVKNYDYPPAIPPDPNIEVTVTPQNFDGILQQSFTRPVVLEIGAPWCSACRELKPHMQQFAKDDKGAWLLAQVNGDENPALIKRYAVTGYPTLVALRKGQEVARQVAWNGDPQYYRKWINSVLAKG